MDAENSDLLKKTILQTINFVENIEFSHNIQPKTEIKEEKGFDQEVWKSSPFSVKLKLEQVEASETCHAKIKTEPEEFFSNDEAQTFCNESIEIKDEFMLAMKDFVSDNAPPKNIEQQIAAVNEKKKPFECYLCSKQFARKGYLNRHIVIVHEKKMPYECSLCRNIVGWTKDHLTKHNASIHGNKKIFECSLCLYKIGRKDHLKKHCCCTCKEKVICVLCVSIQIC